MSTQYFRCDWHHDREEDPTRVFYEVAADGAVLRLIDMFGDRHVLCQDVADFAGREDELPGHGSLVEISFFDSFDPATLGIPDVSSGELLILSATTADEFAATWERHRVRAF